MDGGAGSDASLVARAREGDLSAFDRLIARHRQRVFGIARQMAGSPEAAQDIAQEAFLQAFRSLDGLRAHDRFGAWLNTILRRQAQRWLRAGDNQSEPADIETLQGIPGFLWQPAPQPPREVMERVQAALGVLSQRERSVMILHYLEGRSCEEIAQRLRISAGSVKRILHYSRRKARKEAEAMAASQEGPGGPRRLIHWIDGCAGQSRLNVFALLRPRLAQRVCLAVNKTAKTAQQISQEAQAHLRYVEETTSDLLEIEVLVSPKKGTYLANFIAFDGADWRRLMGLVRQPAAKVATELAESQDKLRAAFERTPLAASGWAWGDILWSFYGVLVALTGTLRNQPTSYRLPPPERPDGARYWLGGHEEVPGLPPVWSTGLNFCPEDPRSPLHWGYFWTWGLEREHRGLGGDALTCAAVFADGPLGEQEALARLEGDHEHWRGILADLLKPGFLRRTNGQFRLGIPVFTQGDSDVLTPEIDAVMQPIMNDVVVPALTDVDRLLDEMGYGHRREQYPQWHRWLSSNIMGEALRFLMEQGMLPRPGEPAPPTFAFVTWKGDLPLMSWGVQ